MVQQAGRGPEAARDNTERVNSLILTVYMSIVLNNMAGVSWFVEGGGLIIV